MITLSMTYKEMYDNLADDKSKVDMFIDKQLPNQKTQTKRML